MEQFFTDMDELIDKIEEETADRNIDKISYEKLASKLGVEKADSIRNWMNYKYSISGKKKTKAEEYFTITIDSIRIGDLIIVINSTSDAELTSNEKKVLNLLLCEKSLGVPGKANSTDDIIAAGLKYEYKKDKVVAALTRLKDKQFLLEVKDPIQKWRLSYKKCKSFLERR